VEVAEGECRRGVLRSDFVPRAVLKGFRRTVARSSERATPPLPPAGVTVVCLLCPAPAAPSPVAQAASRWLIVPLHGCPPPDHRLPRIFNLTDATHLPT
jgi:hypothetical protein